MKASAPGKLNVTLACSSPDERGYHPLRTVFMAVGLREEVEVIPADRWSLQTTMVDSAGNEMPLPAELSALAPQENLAVRAASALLQKAGIRGAAQLRITKRVPVAGEWPAVQPMLPPRSWQRQLPLPLTRITRT